jgi:hypothetical protein
LDFMPSNSDIWTSKTDWVNIISGLEGSGIVQERRRSPQSLQPRIARIRRMQEESLAAFVELLKRLDRELRI